MPETSKTASPVGTILVVDDDADIRKLVRVNLASVGFRVVEAESGPQALEIFASSPPDVVLLDLMLPGMNGLEICERIRGLAHGAEIPIAFFTAYGGNDNYRQAMAQGPNDFITKPIGRAELVVRVQTLHKLKQLSDDLRNSHARLQGQRADLEQRLQKKLAGPIDNILANAREIQTSSEPSASSFRLSSDIISSAEELERTVQQLFERIREWSGHE